MAAIDQERSAPGNKHTRRLNHKHRRGLQHSFEHVQQPLHKMVLVTPAAPKNDLYHRTAIAHFSVLSQSLSISNAVFGAMRRRATEATPVELNRKQQAPSSQHAYTRAPTPSSASIRLTSWFPKTLLNYFVAPFAPFNASVPAPSPDAAPADEAEEEEPRFALAAASSSFENSSSGSPAPEISSRLHLKSNTLDNTTLNIWR